MRDLVIIGAGGFALEILDCVETINDVAERGGGKAEWRVIGYADDQPSGAAAEKTEHDVLCSPDEIADELGTGVAFHIAIGDNKARQRIAATLEGQGLEPATLVSPRAIISARGSLGAGSYAAHNAAIASHAKCGRHTIINVGAVVGHEAELGDFAQLAPNAVVTGRCRIGVGGYLGSNASIFPSRTVGSFGAIGGNSFAVGDVADGETVIGNPARAMFKRK
ncbi:MAG: hypothetical protein WA985_02115 [Erythrobacter sp.]